MSYYEFKDGADRHLTHHLFCGDSARQNPDPPPFPFSSFPSYEPSIIIRVKLYTPITVCEEHRLENKRLRVGAGVGGLDTAGYTISTNKDNLLIRLQTWWECSHAWWMTPISKTDTQWDTLNGTAGPLLNYYSVNVAPLAMDQPTVHAQMGDIHFDLLKWPNTSRELNFNFVKTECLKNING